MNHWISEISAKTERSQCLLQLISAQKKVLEGRKEEATRAFEEGLQAFQPLFPTPTSQHMLGILSEIAKVQERYVQAISILSVHFPVSHTYALCLNNLALLNDSMNKQEQAKTYYLHTLSIYSVHFPTSCAYASCLMHLAMLYKSTFMKKQAINTFQRALGVYSVHFPHSRDYVHCLMKVANLHKCMNKEELAENSYQRALGIYSTHFPTSKD